MKKRTMQIIVLLLCFSTFAAEPGRILRSVAFPGMGQLGDGQEIKGLAFMATEVALVSLFVGSLSNMNSYAFETEKLMVEYSFGGDYNDEIAKNYKDWKDAHGNYDSYKTRSFVFGGLAGACWILNVVDAFLLPPPESNEQLSLARAVAQNTHFYINGKSLSVALTCNY
ncbi:MAG: hypothetical protein GF398_11700 [Chitinivibrionales bacterium]|nr:hypothetical protein [Chitinivibrionales bacterium]